jgi:hypothetical protein
VAPVGRPSYAKRKSGKQPIRAAVASQLSRDYYQSNGPRLTGKLRARQGVVKVHSRPVTLGGNLVMPAHALIAGPQVGIDVLCFEHPFVQRPSPAPKQLAIAVHKSRQRRTLYRTAGRKLSSSADCWGSHSKIRLNSGRIFFYLS